MEPQAPQIEHRSNTIGSGKNLTVRVGEQVDVQCRARYGNPPAIIKWFIGEWTTRRWIRWIPVD